VYDATFVGIHRSESESGLRVAYALGGVARHRAKLCFSGSAEVLHVANKAFALRKSAPERLIDEMLDRAQQLAAFTAQKRRILAVQFQQTTFRRLGRPCREFELATAEDLIQKCLRLLASFVHKLHSLAFKFLRPVVSIKSNFPKNCLP
jgi:hypothetical protein